MFLSARSGRKNVFRLDLATGEATQLTAHDGSDVRRPRAAADGSIVAYEFEDAIWTVTPTAGDAPRRLSVDVAADLVVNPVERRVDRSDAEDLAVSADGTLAAFVVHGDVFVAEITSKEDQEIAEPATVRVTATPEREQDPQFAPDGSTLVFASARNGSLDLYSAAPADPETPWSESFEFSVTRLTDLPGDERSPRFAPDGTRIAFVANRGDLMVVGRRRRQPSCPARALGHARLPLVAGWPLDRLHDRGHERQRRGLDRLRGRRDAVQRQPPPGLRRRAAVVTGRATAGVADATARRHLRRVGRLARPAPTTSGHPPTGSSCGRAPTRGARRPMKPGRRPRPLRRTPTANPPRPR